MGLAFQGFYERGRFTQAMLLPCGLATPNLVGLRRGLASGIFQALDLGVNPDIA
jgi:hypothetical protein